MLNGPPLSPWQESLALKEEAQMKYVFRRCIARSLFKRFSSAVAYQPFSDIGILVGRSYTHTLE